jgi:uncharacterized membrane protein
VRGRLWEIDILRGIAVVAMVLYHFSYDLAYFGLLDLRFFRSGLGLDLGRAIGSSFILLAGLSLTLSYQRAIISRPAGWKLFRKYLGRGLRIFSYGLAITFVTWIFVPREMIVFGILHLIGASIILAYPFLSLKLPNIALAVGCIVASLYLRNLSFDDSWLVWLGTRPNFPMLDYWPVFPWFGVVLLGIFIGNVLYSDQRKRVARTAPSLPLSHPLAFLGRHSLPVYLVHQPILLATLVLLGVGNAEAVL